MLIGHWKLQGDCRDYSGLNNHGANHGVRLPTEAAAEFDGAASYIEVPPADSLALGKSDFSICAWIRVSDDQDDLAGDILSKYDPVSRKGVNLSVLDRSGVCSHQPNFRNLHFGIDDGKTEPSWTDHGWLGSAMFVPALCVYDDSLYAGTTEWCRHDGGHVWRFLGGDQWEDCGSPDDSNSVFALAVYDGHLYAGTAHYRFQDSSLPTSPNDRPGGRIYRYEGGKRWIECGRLANPETGEADGVGAMSVFQGRLYVTPLKAPGMGLYEYDGSRLRYIGHPGKRVLHGLVFNGSMYFNSYDFAGSFRWDPDGTWTDLSEGLEADQTYGYAAYEGQMYLATWPNARVYRYDGSKWQACGAPPNEKESMSLMVYNGKMYTGTLPGGRVYRYDGADEWTQIGDYRLDKQMALYRRVWSMCIYRGRMFCGTLPSGRVLSIEAGKNATYDKVLPAGWRHVAAVRGENALKLYVDGQAVADSAAFDPDDYDLANTQPLKIGFGASDHFDGCMCDVRMHDAALDEREIRSLAAAGCPAA